MFETSPPSITIQGRMERIIDDRPATWHTGLAFGDSDQSFQVILFPANLLHCHVCFNYTVSLIIMS